MRQRICCHLEYPASAGPIVEPPSSIFLPTNPLNLRPQHLSCLSHTPTPFQHNLDGRRNPPNIIPRPPKRYGRNKPHANGLTPYFLLPLTPVFHLQRRERLCPTHHSPAILRNIRRGATPKLRICSGAVQPVPSKHIDGMHGGGGSRDKSAPQTHTLQRKAMAADMVCS